jgi:hypothetical protein
LSTDPTTFTPQKNESLGVYESWGLPKFTESDTPGPEILGRVQRVAALRGSSNAPPSAESRFLKALKEKKTKELERYEKESGKVPCGRDYVFDLVFMQCEDKDGKPMITREFRCSGDMNLRTWVDKVLIPMVGYKRG